MIGNRYAVLTPDGFAKSHLPGWENSECVVLISPALGAQFSLLSITMNKDGQGKGNTGKTEYFAYVVEGSASVTLDAKRHRMEAGGFVYIPPTKDIHFQGANSKLLIFQKKYEALDGVEPPKVTHGSQREVRSHPYLGHESVKFQALIPEGPGFDMAVTIFTYQPASALPFVETPSSEHGVTMLQGQGLYRVGSDYHPVQAGDTIWAGAYRPQWFLPMGKAPAAFIRYSDVNRDPL